MGEISSVPFHDSVFLYISGLLGLKFYKTLTQKEKGERKKQKRLSDQAQHKPWDVIMCI